MKFLVAGDSAVIAEFGNEISEEVNARVVALDRALRARALSGVVETVPTYRSLLVNYDPLVVSLSKIKKTLTALSLESASSTAGQGRVVEVPVCYGGEFGEDLPDVAKHTGLSEQEVIARHSSTTYLVYMLGFLPGFAYLGGMDKALATPRLPSPRAKIPARSVGIGGEQTGIYPLASPGGWRLIGSTPIKPYDPSREEPILFKAGDRVKFVPIGADEYRAIERDAGANHGN